MSTPLPGGWAGAPEPSLGGSREVMTGTAPGVGCGTLGRPLTLSQPRFPNVTERMTIPTLSEDEIYGTSTEQQPCYSPLLGAGKSALKGLTFWRGDGQ